MLVLLVLQAFHLRQVTPSSVHDETMPVVEILDDCRRLVSENSIVALHLETALPTLTIQPRQSVLPCSPLLYM